MTSPETSAADGAAAGLPTATVHCPACDTDRLCQQIVDHPDDPATAPVPYACLTCGCEFSIPKS